MSSLAQYIDLYNTNRDIVFSNSAPLLNVMRDQAVKIVKEAKSLPTKSTEGYEKTSIEDMFAPDMGININRVPIPVNVASTFRCDIPNMSTLMAFILNDTFVHGKLLQDKLPKGVIVDSLAHAAVVHKNLVEQYYGRIAPATDAGVALNTMLVQDGVFIYIPRGLVMERPLQLVNIFSSPTDLLAFRRLLIIIEDGAKAQLLVCDHTQHHDNSFLSSQVIEISLGNGACFELLDIEESSPLTSRYSQLFANQQEGSQLRINGVTLIGGNTRNNYDINLLGRNCETTLAGMAIGSASQHTDNSSNVRHYAPCCRSNQLFKYVLDDQSTGAFEGSIVVSPEAQFTEAYQSNRNMLASTNARMHTKPQLEIYCDDVKCSHGATTGQLDNDALFYMRSRGISEQEARLMLMQAFMSDVIDTVTMEGMRDRLRHLVEKRFYGKTTLCSDCSASCH